MLEAGQARGLWPVRAAADARTNADGTLPRLILVDCRAVAERDVSSIPTSIHQSEFEAMVKTSSVPRPAVVVCFCTIGFRSGMFAKGMAAKFPGSLAESSGLLETAGSAESDTQVRFFNMRGSLLAWTHVDG